MTNQIFMVVEFQGKTFHVNMNLVETDAQLSTSDFTERYMLPAAAQILGKMKAATA